MKKRILILVSTLVCALTTVALVVVTLVGALKKGSDSVPEGTDVPTTNVGVQGDANLTNEYSYVNLIIGDEFSDGFVSVSNYTGTLLEATSETTFVAKVAGSEQFAVQTESVVRSYTITVYEKGDGSEANPFNIIRAEDLIKLTSENSGEFKYYSQRMDLDLSSFESWAPIGKLTAPFIGSYNGNGYSINNLKIAVTTDNIDNYLDNALSQGGSNAEVLTVGFFGFVGEVDGASTSCIKNVNINNASIDTSAIETDAVRPTINITQSFVGTLAGYAAHTEIISEDKTNTISSTINSAVSSDNTTSFYTAVSGMVGGAYYANISGYNVDAKIATKNPGVIKINDNKTNYYGSVFAGVLGYNFNSNVQDIVVSLSADVKNYEGTIVAGAIAHIETGKNKKDNLIKNITVKNLYVKLNKYSNFNTYAGIVAGAINANFNSQSVMENIVVENAVINAIGTGQISGIINTNYGTIINPQVTGIMKGTIVAAIAYENYGTIKFTEEMQEQYAIDVDLRGQTAVAGMVVYNYGTISGASNLTSVKAALNWSIVNAYFEENKNRFMMAGIAAYNYGMIENIQTETNIYDAVNAGGAVGVLQGTITNCNINSTIRTIAGKVGVTKYSGKSNLIGGIAAKTIGNSAAIIDVNANVTVNNTEKINTQNLYGLNVFGSIVAYAEGDVVVKSEKGVKNVVQITLFTNYSQNSVQYVGSVVGQTKENTNFSLEDTEVVIAILQTAEGAIVS